jgi:hypothetical protein
MNEKWVNAIHVLSNEIRENDTLMENSQITQQQIGLKMSHMIDILWFIMMQSVNLCRTRTDNTQYAYVAKQKVSFSLFPSMFSYYWIVEQYILITVWCKSSYKSTVFAPVGKNTANMLKSRTWWNQYTPLQLCCGGYKNIIKFNIPWFRITFSLHFRTCQICSQCPPFCILFVKFLDLSMLAVFFPTGANTVLL